jgi:hypothetical protein
MFVLVGRIDCWRPSAVANGCRLWRERYATYMRHDSHKRGLRSRDDKLVMSVISHSVPPEVQREDPNQIIDKGTDLRINDFRLSIFAVRYSFSSVSWSIAGILLLLSRTRLLRLRGDPLALATTHHHIIRRCWDIWDTHGWHFRPT